MTVRRFDYTIFHNAKAPVIPIEIQGRGRWHKLWVYVDSGASFTVLHTFEARRLGVNLKKCRKIALVSAGNRDVPVYMKKLVMRVGRRSFRAEVGFCRGLGDAFNLLGRKDVFDRFQVCFDDKREVITFRSR
jgi:hypothetical protein